MKWAFPSKLSPMPSAILFLFLIALIAPAAVHAQKHNGGGGGSAPPPHPSGGGGGGNAGGGGNHGGGSTGGNNSYGGNHAGSTGGSNGTMGGSHNSSNPYGSYGGGNKGGATGGTEAGKSSNPYGGASGGNKSTSMYGSYGSKTPSTGGEGGAAGTGGGNKGGTSMYGSAGNRGGTGTSGLNGGTKGGTSSFGGNSKSGTNSFGSSGKGGANANNNARGGVGGANGTHGGNTSLSGRGGSTAGGKGGFGEKGGNSFAGKSGPPPGGKSITRSNGDRVDFNRSGTRTSLATKGGNVAHFDSHGRVNSIQSHGMMINHAGRGRTVVSERADHSRLVSMGRGRGYSERGFRRGGHEFRSRTYYYHGRAYARAYRGYYWHGYGYYRYAPAYWYSPGFYGWAYNPWATPVAYGWGWGGAPWYGYYGYYFQPYPVYPSAAFWITDYALAQSLQAAYDAGQDSARLGGGELVLAAANQSVVLTADTKKAIAEEIAAIIAAEKDSAANSNADSGNGDVPPDALDPKHRVFVVSSALSEQTADGTSCSLGQGDVITRVDDTPDADHNVKVSVTASQKDDCSQGSQVSVSMDDLQEMHNHLREQVDDGLSALSKNQGKGGIPTGPAGSPRQNPDGQAQADPNVGNDLQQQQSSADQAEKDVQQSAGADNGA